MTALRLYQDPIGIRRSRILYDWNSDYPVSLQKSNRKKKESEFTLEFELTSEEVLEFKNRYNHQLNGYLPIRISFGQDNRPELKVVKKGKGSKELNQKSRYICRYIAQNIEFNYIPAVRTEDYALREIRRQVMRELTSLENDKRYKDAVQTISSLQEPIMEGLEDVVKATLSNFLPNISYVSISFENRITMERYRDVSIRINDGQDTDIQNKGDGVKSLVTLALLNNIHINDSGMSVVAIEEPEAHLHPEAINRLRDTIYSLSVKSQVIISTHNPLFVNREQVGKNIIVEDGVAKQANNIRDIRNVLGVKVSDNLYDAEVMLLVEGETDAISLKAILSDKSKKLKTAISTHRLSIMPMGGTGGLSYYLTMTSQLIGQAVVFIDSDEAAKQAIKKALDQHLINDKNYILCACDGMKNSEFEDSITINIYRQAVIDKYNVDLNTGKMRNKSKIWSNKVQEVFNDCGKLWNEDVENDIKYVVATCVCQNVKNAIDETKCHVIDSLVSIIEAKL
jgi:predicted ATP-dependent endonuclease of OLD family